jgi:hypothetical protein
MSDQAELFAAVGKALYGKQWKGEMARNRNVRDKTVDEWAMGVGPGHSRRRVGRAARRAGRAAQAHRRRPAAADSTMMSMARRRVRGRAQPAFSWVPRRAAEPLHARSDVQHRSGHEHDRE